MSIVITGVGMISAVGDSADECWSQIVAGRSGLTEVDIVPHTGLISNRAGEVRSELVNVNSRTDRSVILSRIALAEALSSAGLDHESPYSSRRAGLALGTSLGGARQGEEFHRQWLAKGLRRADAGLLRQYPLHATADSLAAEFELFGPRTVHSNACAAGSVAIANGMEYLRTDVADMVVVGGVDPLAYFSFGGFSCLGALSPVDCAPYSYSEGLTLGEGAGFLVLERIEAARERGATILAELAGYGLSADAHHPTAPDPRGRGAVAAMMSALAMARASMESVDYINGHGTGTPANDGGEKKILLHFSELDIPMSSTKSMIGHTLGAAGAVEAVTTVLALREQVLPPTVIPPDFDGPLEFDTVPNIGRESEISLAISNSFAFGGNNSTLVFRRNPVASPISFEATRSVTITGMAAMVGAAVDTESAAEALYNGTRLYGDTQVSVEEYGPFPTGEIPENVQKAGINPSALRRLDDLGKRSTSVIGQLIKKRGLTRQDLQSTGLIFATASGPMSTVEAFQRGLINNGVGNTRLFPNTVMNASAGHVALLHGLKGPTATFCAGSTSAVSALHFGQQLVSSGACDRIIVLSADEASTALLAGYMRIPGYLSTEVLSPFGDSGRVYSGAAAAVLLEAGIARDDESGIGQILGFGFAGDDSGCGNVKANPQAWADAMSAAIHAAGLASQDIDVVVAAALGRRQIDDLEQLALRSLGLGHLPVSAPKAILGDTQSTAALLGVHQSVWMKDRGRVPETHHFANGFGRYVRLDSENPLRVLVNSMEVGGNYQSLVVEVF